MIQEATKNGCRRGVACRDCGISLKTFERWGKNLIDQRNGPITSPANKLSAQERSRILQIATSPEYRDLTPWKIVSTLADQAIYVASESSFYRVLKQHGEQHHRGRSRERRQVRHELTTHQASGPKELWSWDVTYLPSRVKGQFFYLYMIIDVFSRKIVGYEVYEQETG
ncbi:MAG: IS3 family transposase, partial [Burkholderiaceae bacterium]|nr:IS3 family transposase [Burkholderiaceae bacterium]